MGIFFSKCVFVYILHQFSGSHCGEMVKCDVGGCYAESVFEMDLLTGNTGFFPALKRNTTFGVFGVETSSWVLSGYFHRFRLNGQNSAFSILMWLGKSKKFLL